MMPHAYVPGENGCATCAELPRHRNHFDIYHNAFMAEVEKKPSNPKDIIGSDKLPMGGIPGVVAAYASLAHMEGLLKYGQVNWRECGVRASIYLDAMQRHFWKYKDAGEWADPTTRVPHLASIIACAAIILDAQLAGKLIDDRPKPNEALAPLIDELGSTVQHLKRLFAEHNPRHYTIADREREGREGRMGDSVV